MTRRLLAVGNDQVLLMTRGEVMMQAGYSVTTAQDLTTFVQQFRSSDFDLVILCYTLPEDQRQAIAAFVRQHSSCIPIMAVSALSAQWFDYADLTVENDPASMMDGIRQLLAPGTRQSSSKAHKAS